MQWLVSALSVWIVTNKYVAANESFVYKNANIVFIIADDLGWDDVSFHGSNQSFTPNIDLLAYTGIALSRYYSHSVCTPSRSALLSGKYAHTLGMQGYPLTGGEDRGIPTNVKLLPQYLKDLGYRTHLVGKWHVGHSRNAYLPTSRGFDSHFGHRCGYVDYYDYTLEETWDIGPVNGFDLYKNFTPAWDVEGYITDVYNQEALSIIQNHNTTSPLFLMVAHNAPHAGNDGSILQAPPEVVRQMRYLENAERRYFSAMVRKLDESVGDIVTALYEKQILDNTIIVFTSDNGGMTSGLSGNFASNWPLRGVKFTPFEGGTRLPGVIWTPTIQKNIWDGYIHSIDWLPTLLGAIGAEAIIDSDGINLWDDITANRASKRNEFYEIDDYDNIYSITSGPYKYIRGDLAGKNINHQGADLRGLIENNAPIYVDLLTESKVYSVLNSIEKPFNLELISVREKIQVNCTTQSTKKLPLCYPTLDRGCLYNIHNDPCELKDISVNQPDITNLLSVKLNEEIKRAIRRLPLIRQKRGLPKLQNYTWHTFAESSG